MSLRKFTIEPATSPTDLAAVAHLFTTYVAWLNIDLTYQNFADELRTLPGKYAPEAGGALFVAKSSDGATVLGCIGLRRLTDRRAEIKRLYVSENGRGLGLGRDLVAAVVQRGRDLGYVELVLDTLPSMRAARKLYGELGFVEVSAYYETPVEGTIFLCKTF